MVLIWEMSFWTQLAPYRRSVRVKYIISFFFWIFLKKVCFLVSGFWWAFISPFLLWRLLQSSLTRFFHVEGCLWGCRLSLRLHWIDSDFFVCVFHPFLSCSTLPFLLYNSLHSLSSPCPLFIFARQIKKKWHEVFFAIYEMIPKGFSKT